MAAAEARRLLWTVIGVTVGGCGLAALTAPHGSAAPVAELSALLFLGSSVHVASTACLFGFGEVRRYAASHPARYLGAPVALVAATATAATVGPARMLSVGLLGYFGWQLHHYQKQNLGLAALAVSAYQVTPLGRSERQAIVASGWAGIAALWLRPSLLQLAVHPPAGAWLTVARAAITAAFGLIVGRGAVAFACRGRAERPATVCASYATAVLFPLPIFVFGSPYAAVGGLTIAHGLQYLLLVWRVSVGPAPRHARPAGVIAVGIGVLAGAVGLSLASHLHDAGPVGRALYGCYLGLVMSHFVVDAGLWRLRDSFPRRFLTARLPSLLNPPPVSACDVSAYGVASAA